MKQFFSTFTLVLSAYVVVFTAKAQTSFSAFAPEIGVTTCPASNVNFLAGDYANLPSGITFTGYTRNVVTCTNANTHYRSSGFTNTTKADAINDNRYVTWSFSTDATVFFTLNEVALRHERSAQGADNGALYYSINGAPFEQVGIDFAITESNTRTVTEFTSPVTIPVNSTIEFRWYCWRINTAGSGNVRIKGAVDYATGSGMSGTFTSTLPSVIVSPQTLNPFNQVLGNPSAEQSFVVSGVNLTQEISINPPLGYEVSLSSGMDYVGGLFLSPDNGVVANTTIYIRLDAASEGVYNGNVEVGSLETGIVNVVVNGIASLLPPPEITSSPSSLSNFFQFLGTPSEEQTLLVSGQYLTDNVIILAPLGFEVSSSSGSGFVSSLELTQNAGELEPTTVYVRLNHTIVGTIVDVITLSTTGTDPVDVPVSGSVEEPVPANLGVSPSELNPFLQNLGFPSATQILTVGGENLLGNITVTCTGNFFMSTSIGGPFSQSVILEPFGDYVDPTQIYVHLNATSAGQYTGIITVTTLNVASVEIDLTGTAVAPSGALLYYWHFNTLETPEDVTSIDADYSLVPGVTGSFEYTNPIEGERDMDAFDSGSLLNAQMGEGSGKAVRVRNPSTDRTLDFFVPTNLASGITFTYTVQRSNAGMSENVFSYSIDGENFITDGLTQNVVEVTTAYVIYSIDFTNISAANDNPNFRIRISFNGNTSSTGNNRIDNITLFADTYLATASFDAPMFVVYPNPAEAFIQIFSSEEVKQISVLDLNGRVVMVSNNTSVDIHDLQAGLYIMHIETTQGAVQRQFVKK